MPRLAKNPGIGQGKGGGRQNGERIKSHRGRAWDEIGEYILNTGAYRYTKIISKMPDEKFLNRFETMLEYFKPKLGRIEHASDKENPLTFNIINFNMQDRAPTMAEAKEIKQIIENDTRLQIQTETVSDTVFKSF